MTSRLGWICARCGNSLSPDNPACPACTRPPGTPGPRGPIPPEPLPEGIVTAPRRRDYPVGTPAAVPCPPSREGAMCGCVEDEETPRWHDLADLLDAMAGVSATTHRRIGPAWSEALPGVEFRMTGGAGTEVLVEFRARPREEGA